MGKYYAFSRNKYLTYLTYLLTNLKPTYPPTNRGSKKQRIWELVSDGKYSPDRISSIVGTDGGICVEGNK